MEGAIREQVLKRLVAFFQKLTDFGAVEGLFNNLFTRTERVMFAKRLAIAVLLERGTPYSVISKTLKVSNSTIGFVRNHIMSGNREYTALIKSLDKII